MLLTSDVLRFASRLTDWETFVLFTGSPRHEAEHVRFITKRKPHARSKFVYPPRKQSSIAQSESRPGQGRLSGTKVLTGCGREGPSHRGIGMRMPTLFRFAIFSFCSPGLNRHHHSSIIKADQDAVVNHIGVPLKWGYSRQVDYHLLCSSSVHLASRGFLWWSAGYGWIPQFCCAVEFRESVPTDNSSRVTLGG